MRCYPINFSNNELPLLQKVSSKFAQPNINAIVRKTEITDVNFEIMLKQYEELMHNFAQRFNKSFVIAQRENCTLMNFGTDTVVFSKNTTGKEFSEKLQKIMNKAK